MTLAEHNALWERFKKLDHDTSRAFFGAAIFGRHQAMIELGNKEHGAIGRVLTTLVESFEEQELKREGGEK